MFDTSSVQSLIAPLITLVGLAAAVSIIFEAIKKMANFTPDFLSKWGPVMAIALGIVLGGGAALIQHSDIATAIVYGVLAGLNAVGIYHVSPDGLKFGTATSTTP